MIKSINNTALYLICTSMFLIVSCGQSRGVQQDDCSSCLNVSSSGTSKDNPAKVESVLEYYQNSPSKLTLHIIETNPNFCSAENRQAKRQGKVDILTDVKDVFRDLTVKAICLDGSKKGREGYELALNTALIAQTYDVSFEHENLLYLTIATSYKASEGEIAWALNTFEHKKLNFNVDSGTARSLGLAPPRGRVLRLRERYLFVQHRKPF